MIIELKTIIFSNGKVGLTFLNSTDFYFYFQVILVLGALQLSRTVLDKYPDMLSAHLIARLLPEMKNLMYIRSLIHQCDNEGFIHNCLVPLRHYLASPGGPLKYSLEGKEKLVKSQQFISYFRFANFFFTKIGWNVQFFSKLVDRSKNYRQIVILPKWDYHGSNWVFIKLSIVFFNLCQVCYSNMFQSVKTGKMWQAD